MVTLAAGQGTTNSTIVFLVSIPVHGLTLSYSLTWSLVHAVVPAQAPFLAAGDAVTRETRAATRTERESIVLRDESGRGREALGRAVLRSFIK